MLPGDWLGTKLGHKLTKNEYEHQQFIEAIISFFIFLPIRNVSQTNAIVSNSFFCISLYGIPPDDGGGGGGIQKRFVVVAADAAADLEARS